MFWSQNEKIWSPDFASRGPLGTLGNYYVLITTAPGTVWGVKTAKMWIFSFLGSLLAPSEPREQPRRAKLHQKHFHTVRLGWTHPYHALGPLKGPLWPPKGLVLAPKCHFGGPWGPRRAVGARFGPNYPPLARLGWIHGHHTLWPGIGPLLGLRGL